MTRALAVYPRKKVWAPFPGAKGPGPKARGGQTMSSIGTESTEGEAPQ